MTSFPWRHMRTQHFVAVLLLITAGCGSDSSSPGEQEDRVTAVEVSGRTTLMEGETTGMTALLRGTSGAPFSGPAKPVTWTSSNPAVATVTATSGDVTAVAAGTTTITATCDGISGSRTVAVVREPVASVVVEGARSLAQGDSLSLRVVVRGGRGNELANRSVAWTTSNPGAATVSATGMVRAVGRTGSATITATVEGIQASTAVPVWWLYRSPQVYPAQITRDLTINDRDGRSIPVQVVIPVGASAPLPVVVGYPGDAWIAVLRSAGYAVISPAAGEADSRTCAEFGITAADCTEMLKDQFGPNGSPLLLLSLARRISAVMDSLDYISRTVDVQFDRQKIAAIGSSRGGAVALQLAGTTIDVLPSIRNVSVRDARFAAYVGNSPPGTTTTAPVGGVTQTSWQTITAPALVQTGSGDVWGRREPFDRMPAGDKYLAYYDALDVDHLAFGLATSPPAPPRSPLQNYIATVGIAFLDAYLRNNAEARAWLVNSELTRGTDGVVRISTK